jgi:hypothetical protein
MGGPTNAATSPLLGRAERIEPSAARDDAGGMLRRVATLVGPRRPERLGLTLLFVILAVGAALRVLLMLAWSPAFMGFSDATAYVSMASRSLWGDPTHEVGYALFLRDLHALGGQLWPTIVIQHISGLLSATLWWLILRRCGARPWLATIPAAVIALGGGEMFLEHSTMSESLFILLLSGGVYCAVRGLDVGGARWSALSALALALACTVRVVALPLFGVLLVWLALMSGGSVRRRVRHTAIAAACGATILGGYAVVQHGQTGYWGLTTPAGAWNLYSRVAPFADCHKFRPPPGTAALCESTPPARRKTTVDEYAYTAASPAVRAYSWGDGPYTATPRENRQLASFAKAVVVHQPADYAKTFLEGMVAYVAPIRIEFRNRTVLAPDDQAFFHHNLFAPGTLATAVKDDLPYYGVQKFHEDRPLMSFLFAYESVARVTGPLMAAMMLLSFFALFAPAGRPRQVARLLFLIAWVSLIVPPATHQWDARYTIPALGPLTAVATLGGWQVGRLAKRGALRWRSRFLRAACRPASTSEARE